MADPTQLPMEFTSGSRSYDAHAVSRGRAMRVAKLSQETRKEASRGFGGKLWVSRQRPSSTWEKGKEGEGASGS